METVAIRDVLEELQALAREEAAALAAREAGGRWSVAAAAARLAGVGSPEGILERSARELGEAWAFDRVLVSVIDGDCARPHACWREGAAAPAFGEQTIALAYPLVEAEALATRTPQLVDVAEAGGRTPDWLVDALQLTEYALAVATLDGRPVALLHAARADGASAFDAELLGVYAHGLGEALELVLLQRALAEHRAELRTAVTLMSARLDGADEPQPAEADPELQPLTTREAEVLRLMAAGLTNHAIADRLVISEGTAKYHVKNILRKLGAANRADAVARHRRAAARHAA